MSDDTDNHRYPTNIQRLFAPKPPLIYKPPLDYPSESRKTCSVGPVSSWKSKITDYLSELDQIEKDHKAKQEHDPALLSALQLQSKRERKLAKKQSFERQLREWNDPELLLKHEQEFMKDPYKTVFVARLDYSLTEIDISKNFSRFGAISSIRLIRDKQTGQSKGYGFIVFERDADCAHCIRELAPVGLKLVITDTSSGTSVSSNRTALVDMERGRVMRSWKPRRLGGGLGGRHYTKPTVSANASAAASGRRMNLSLNPYQNESSGGHFTSSSYTPASSGVSSYTPASSGASSYTPASSGASSYTPASSGVKRPAPSPRPAYTDNKRPSYGFVVPPTTSAIENNEPIRDKYARYTTSAAPGVAAAKGSSDSARGSRSIRSIRSRD